MCDLFQKGMCSKGEMCMFAHGEHELRSTPDLFKTSLCFNYNQGKCMLGEMCRYAHGY